MSKYCTTSIPQNSPPSRRVEKVSIEQESLPEQLDLFPLLPNRAKPQIASVPGASIKERDRYRVIIGDEILGDRLSLDEALRVAKRGGEDR